MAGIDPGHPAAADYRHGIYTAEWTERTYRELLHRARRLLARGETVVLDASWTREPMRRAALLVAAEAHVPLVELRCTAAAATVADRLRRRNAVGTDASDADNVVASALAADTDLWPEAHVVATDVLLEQVTQDAITFAARCLDPANATVSS
jgi:predicted kinase